MYDIAVVGGGPAGLSAAIHGRARNLSVVVVSNEPGKSPLVKAERVDNFPGMPESSGAHIVDTMVEQAKQSGAELRIGRVLNVMPMGASAFLSVGADVIEARAVILATGVVRRASLPGEQELLGRGVSYCATCDGMLYRGKRVVVSGNAPDLEEETAFLREIGCLVEEVPLKGLKILGSQRVEGVESEGRTLSCEGVFLLRSTLAMSNLVPGLEMEDGHIKVDRYMRTNIEGIYAAGDCTGAPLQISKAVGEGQMAVHSAQERMS